MCNIDTSLGHLPEITKNDLSDQQVLEELTRLKGELKDQMVVLGHHYQNNEIIKHADIVGDSLHLSNMAKEVNKPNIVFCGVHFMAETADILTSDNQKIILPDLNAGCSMADMARIDEVKASWKFLCDSTDKKIVPITYVNCTASLKAFVGRNDGTICTSSNAKKIVKWALGRGEKIFFFPDQHLGRNVAYDLGIPLDDMVIYDPNSPCGGLKKEEVKKAKVILWYGYCSVHQGFNITQIKQIRKKHPEMKILAHSECSFDVAQSADLHGSTSDIINEVKNSPSGSMFAIGTEINLVDRLARQNPNKKIVSLSPYQCLCTTMYRIRPRWLLSSFMAIKRQKINNIIKVPQEIKYWALKAIETMLKI